MRSLRLRFAPTGRDGSIGKVHGVVSKNLSQNKAFRWALVVLWMAVIFILSGQPDLPSFSVGWADELKQIAGHFLAFGVLAAALHWALSGSGIARPALWALAIAFCYALSDEFHQSFVPNRHPDPFDILADATGAACALLLLSYLRSRRLPR